MSLADANKRSFLRLSAITAASALLAGCFTPIYAERAPGTSTVSDRLKEIDVAPMSGRYGIVTYNELNFLLTGGPGRRGTNGRYRLVVSAGGGATPVFVESISARPQVVALNYGGTFYLQDMETKQVVYRGNASAAISIDRNQQTLAYNQALHEAYERGARTIAQHIVSQISTWLATQK